MEFAANYPASAGINDSYTQAAAKVVGVFSFMWERMKGLRVLNIVLVFAGGGIGATMRYWMDGAVQRWAGSTFPYGTFVVNSLGCFMIGFLMTSLEERFLGNPSMRIFLAIGILGGFTTFSTFSYETAEMMRSAEYFYAAVNVSITVFTCLAATYVGTVIGKIF